MYRYSNKLKILSLLLVFSLLILTTILVFPSPASAHDSVWWQSPAPININPMDMYLTPLVGPNQTDKLRLSMLPIVPGIPGDVIVQLEQNGTPLTGFMLYYDGVSSWSLSGPAPGIAVTSDTSGNIEVTFVAPLVPPPLQVTNVRFMNLMPLPLAIGTIQFITYVPNQAPVADADGPYSGSVGELITFDGSASYDPDGIYGDQIISWEWEFTGDGQYDDASGEIVQWSWGSPYSGSIGLNVTDTDGASDTDEADVSVTFAPTPSPVEVGGEVYSVNKVSVLAPWIALAAAILLISGITLAVRRRRI